VVIAELARSNAERGYPAGIGSNRLRDAARNWMERRFGVVVERSSVAACIGTKELVAGLPHWLHLRRPDRDTVLYPKIAYPTYAMGAELAGCRAVGVPSRPDGSMDLSAVSVADRDRALCLWLNSPSNPTGFLDDLPAGAAFGREHGIPVLSDECYTEFTFDRAPETILSTGLDGVLAVHSISKRSNCAGLRVGFYAGDPDLVHYLSELRRHAGFMVPGPIQAAGAAALEDDEHVTVQRARYLERLERFAAILASIGITAELPPGGFYLWVEVPDEDRFKTVPGESLEWGCARYLAEIGGALVGPGEFYGDDRGRFIRIAVVQTLEDLERVADRLALGRPGG
jgi:aspartate/methionine/tyrosine aminotransferase